MRLRTFYNIINGNIDIPTAPYLTPVTHDHDTRGAHIKYHLPITRVHVYSNSFFPASITLWNPLPQTITKAASVEVFRARLGAVNLTR